MIQGTALRPSAAIEAWYGKELRVLVLAMHKAVLKEFTTDAPEASTQSLNPDGNKPVSLDGRAESGVSFSQDALITFPYPYTTASAREQAKIAELRAKFDRIFQRAGQVAALRFIEKQIKHASTSFVASVRPMIEGAGKQPFTLMGSLMTAENSEFLKAAIKDNVALIKTIPAQYFDKIESAVQKSISVGGERKTLVSEIQRIGGVTERRAKFIARDQTAKVYGEIAVENMKRAGITKVKWLHSGAGKVPREYHKTRWDGVSEPPNGLNGYIYDINNPPVADLKTGERAVAGQLINCRCVSVPVIDV